MHQAYIENVSPWIKSIQAKEFGNMSRPRVPYFKPSCIQRNVCYKGIITVQNHNPQTGIYIHRSR